MNETDWTNNIPMPDEWGAAVFQPDDTPFFDPATSSEVDTTLRLKGDRQLTRTPTRRLFHDYRANPDAYRYLEHLPGPGETLHGIISGKFALFELIPALIERTAQPIKHLYIATLSFNKQNAADMLDLYDGGHVKRIDLIISYYYKSTSRNIYDLLIPRLQERGQRTLAIRNHAKIMLSEMQDGRKFAVESSANLRSSQNLENVSITQADDLYAFHQTWMDELFATRKDL